MMHKIDITTGTQLPGEGGGLPCSFLEIEEKCPNFGRKCPVCMHLWVDLLLNI